jgi:hypothetical protein
MIFRQRSRPFAIKKLPRDPSFEHLRKQAKQLLRAYQHDMRPAVGRVRRVFPDKTIRLSEAQHVIAVEYGFPDWSKLTGHVASVTDRSIDKRNDKLVRATCAGDFATIARIVEKGEFVQHDLDFALARLSGDPGEMGEYLIELGADPDGEYGLGYGPIILAHCESCDVAAIRFLLEHGADAQGDAERKTKYFHNTPMRMLLGSYARPTGPQKREAIDLLMTYGATLPPEVDAVSFAIFRGDAGVLGELLSEDPSLLGRRFGEFNYGNLPLHGGTLLHMAADFAESACLEVLLARGADPNARAGPWNDWGGHTPIFHAVVGNPPQGALRLAPLTDLALRGSFERYTWPAGEERRYEDVTARALCEANQVDERGRAKRENATTLSVLIAHGAPNVGTEERNRAGVAGRSG